MAKFEFLPFVVSFAKIRRNFNLRKNCEPVRILKNILRQINLYDNADDYGIKNFGEIQSLASVGSFAKIRKNFSLWKKCKRARILKNLLRQVNLFENVDNCRKRNFCEIRCFTFVVTFAKIRQKLNLKFR